MKTYNVELTDDMVKIVAAGLAELPVKHALPVINELNRQLEPQMKPALVANEEKSA